MFGRISASSAHKIQYTFRLIVHVHVNPGFPGVASYTLRKNNIDYTQLSNVVSLMLPESEIIHEEKSSLHISISIVNES